MAGRRIARRLVMEAGAEGGGQIVREAWASTYGKGAGRDPPGGMREDHIQASTYRHRLTSEPHLWSAETWHRLAFV